MIILYGKRNGHVGILGMTVKKHSIYTLITHVFFLYIVTIVLL